MIRWNGITVKLLLAFFAVLLISFGVTAAISTWFVRSELRSGNERFERDQLSVIAALVRTAYREDWDENVLRSALQATAGPPGRVIYVVDGSGGVLLDTGRPDGEYLSAYREQLQPLLDQGVVITDRTLEGNENLRWSVTPINGPSDLAARSVVLMSGVRRQEINMFNGLYRNIFISMLITAVIIVFAVSRGMTARLRNMSEAARLIAKGRFDVRVKEKPRDEIGELAVSLNEMSGELASLDRMRREFLANVSHDLRSPLTSIGGYVEAMIDGAIPEEKRGAYLGLIREQTQRMNRLVNDLLEVARMEAGQTGLLPAPYNLTEWVRRLLAALEPDFRRRSLSFELDAGPEDVWVYADPDRIDQVLSNLLLNAIQFSPDGRSIEVSIERKEKTAVVGVRDYGVGIPSENLERIWERFYKSDKARSARSGSGLGLSIVKNVLEQHGTTAKVESKPGEGSLFSFELPIVYPPPYPRAQVPRNPPPG
ncbi:sensor histidine kinase [Cohnella algarum]|uniref:sensor histidine kinase n=1 Tax=Cohnella algarum TaxID=2044859 RepID=UPI0019672FDC|nr:ATP-binding protein [Cohnella algarum]MBN2984806.1 HAMP domain-containing protein [Cohnella algarum]